MAEDVALFVLPDMPPQTWRVASRSLNSIMAKLIKDSEANAWPVVRYICFKGLYDKVVPGRLHEALQAAAATAVGDDVPVLRIYAEAHGIPWELMHDGTDFLGLRFQIARLPIGTTGLQLDGEGPRPVQRIYNLLAGNLLDGTLFEDWKKTFSVPVAAQEQEIRFPSADGAGNDFPTLSDLEEAEAPDILHVTCHGGQVDEDDGQVYWTLDHTAKLHEMYRIKKDNWETWRQMKDIFQNQPLVFGNACRSVEVYAAEAEASAKGDARGLGPTFLALGAVAFVGTLVAISEKLSVEFACQFYQKLLGDGLPIAKALWATKKHFAEQEGNDPSWLFYCLYGPPETRFQIA